VQGTMMGSNSPNVPLRERLQRAGLPPMLPSPAFRGSGGAAAPRSMMGLNSPSVDMPKGGLPQDTEPQSEVDVLAVEDLRQSSAVLPGRPDESPQ